MLLIKTDGSAQGPKRVLVTNSGGFERYKFEGTILFRILECAGVRNGPKKGRKRDLRTPVAKFFLSYDCDLGGGGSIS